MLTPWKESYDQSRQHIKKQRHYFADKGLSSQSYGFSSSHWALESITTNKASRGDGIPVELFQILKDDAVKVLHSMSAHLENSAVATGLEKDSFHSNPKERQCQRMLKLLHNCTHLTS